MGHPVYRASQQENCNILHCLGYLEVAKLDEGDKDTQLPLPKVLGHYLSWERLSVTILILRGGGRAGVVG